MTSEQVFCSQYLPAKMLRICSLAGETLATFSSDEVEDKSVKELKIALAKQTGVTRFRQRWLSEDHTELHDDDVVPCCDVQLVVLSFVPAKKYEIRELLSACRENHPHVLIELLRRPLNPDAGRLDDGRSALHLAATRGRSNVVRLLLEAGANNVADPSGQTALHTAAENGEVEIVKLLLQAGSEKDAGLRSGKTALDLATHQTSFSFGFGS